MQLHDLLAERNTFTVGELCQVGLGLARGISANHCQGQTLGPISFAEVEILPDGSASVSKHISRPGADADSLDPREDIRYLAQLLMRIAKQTSLAGTKGYQPLRSLLSEVSQTPILPGDFAIRLAALVPAEPIRAQDESRVWRWLIPSLLGGVALASWGLAIGLWLGV